MSNVLISQAVADAIANHKQAIVLDESEFDVSGNAFDEKRAAATLEDVVAAFAVFVAVPCLSADDVTAKVSYLLNGDVGERTSLIECLTEYDDDGEGALQREFLQSLLVSEAA